MNNEFIDSYRALSWIWRQSEEGKIFDTTSELLFILDGFESNKDSIIKGRDELNDILVNKLGCKTKTGMIDRACREFDMDIE